MQDGLFGIDVSKGITQDEFEIEQEKTQYKKRINKKDLSVVKQVTPTVSDEIQIHKSSSSKTKTQSIRNTDFEFDENILNSKELQ